MSYPWDDEISSGAGIVTYVVTCKRPGESTSNELKRSRRHIANETAQALMRYGYEVHIFAECDGVRTELDKPPYEAQRRIRR